MKRKSYCQTVYKKALYLVSDNSVETDVQGVEMYFLQDCDTTFDDDYQVKTFFTGPSLHALNNY